MKTKKITRFYCDFCGRGMMHKTRMEKHERGCTRNDNRICGMCHDSVGQVAISELVACLDGITKENADERMRKLREMATGCPACILAALQRHPRTSHLLNAKFYKDEGVQSPYFVDVVFDWKEECKKWWDEFNAEQID